MLPRASSHPVVVNRTGKTVTVELRKNAGLSRAKRCAFAEGDFNLRLLDDSSYIVEWNLRTLSLCQSKAHRAVDGQRESIDHVPEEEDSSLVRNQVVERRAVTVPLSPDGSPVISMSL